MDIVLSRSNARGHGQPTSIRLKPMVVGCGGKNGLWSICWSMEIENRRIKIERRSDSPCGGPPNKNHHRPPAPPPSSSMELERIPAASAMDWSIDLDRGLRSRQPGRVDRLNPPSSSLSYIPSLTSALVRPQQRASAPSTPPAHASASSALAPPPPRPSPPRTASCPGRRASSRRPCSSASPPNSGPPTSPCGSASSRPSSILPRVQGR